MQFVDQYNTTTAIAFEVVKNSGDYAGAPGLLGQLSASLSKNGGALQPANGSIIESGGGIYWLAANPQDADTPGPVKMAIATPPGYIAELVDFYVRPPSWWQQLAAIPQNIADMRNDLRELRNIQAPIQDRIGP